MKIVRIRDLLDASFVSSTIAENDHAAWDVATTYGLGDTRIYVAADTHWIVESLQAGNTGHVPTGLASDTWWLKTGNTNRWKMFDGSVQSQSSAADEIEVAVNFQTQRISAVMLLNVDCATAQVTAVSAADGLVYDETKTMVSPSGITDWYSYFFEPITRIHDYAFTDIPPYLDLDITVTLTDTGGTVLCGACLFGLSRTIGGTQYGAQMGIIDYSRKEVDAFGNYTVLERAYSKRASFQVEVANTLVDELQTILAGYRATAAVYIGSDEYASSMLYGFYKDFDVVLQYRDRSILSINIDGLT